MVKEILITVISVAAVSSLALWGFMTWAMTPSKKEDYDYDIEAEEFRKARQAEIDRQYNEKNNNNKDT